MATGFDWLMNNNLAFNDQAQLANPAPLKRILTPEEQAIIANEQAKKDEKPKNILANMQPVAPMQPNTYLNQYSVAENFSSPEARANMLSDREAWKKQLLGVQQDQEAAKSLLEQFKAQPTNVNMAPLAALTDKYAGTNLAQAAKQTAGMSKEEKDAMSIKLQQALAQGDLNVAKEIGDQLQQNKAMEANMRQARQIQSTLGKDYMSKMEAAYKPVEEMNKHYNSVMGGIQPDKNGMVSVRDINTRLSEVARLTGQTGVLTDKDIELVFKNTINRQIADLKTKWGQDGKIPARELSAIYKAVENKLESVKENYEKHLGALSGSYTDVGLDPRTAQSVMKRYSDAAKIKSLAVPVGSPKLDVNALLGE